MDPAVSDETADRRLRVVVDFDGVLHSYKSGWTGPDPADDPEPGALEFVRWLQDRDFDITVVSARAGHPEGQAAIEAWFRRHGFPELEVTDRKVPAVAYIDDRAVHYGSGDWDGCRAAVDELSRHL